MRRSGVFIVDGVAGECDNFYTDNVMGVENENTTSTMNWVIESPNLLSSANGVRYAYLDWIEIRMLIYGSRKYPGTVKVSLIRWNDEIVQPRVTHTTTIPCTGPTVNWRNSTPDINGPYAVVNQTETQKKWNSFWLEKTTPMVANPLILRKHVSSSLYTTLASKVYSFQPRDLSIDSASGGVGEQIVLKWFNNVGKTYRYMRPSDATQPDADEQIVPNEWNQVGLTQLDYACAPKARMSLLIEGTCAGAASANVDADMASSFDLCVRRKMTFGGV